MFGQEHMLIHTVHPLRECLYYPFPNKNINRKSLHVAICCSCMLLLTIMATHTCKVWGVAQIFCLLSKFNYIVGAPVSVGVLNEHIAQST